MDFKIVKYNNELLDEWEKFISESINGTIYHTREFLNYHPEGRFEDFSILIYDNDNIICVLPCCKTKDGFFSHKGATYGGPVFSASIYNTKNLDKIINLIFDYYENKIEFRISSQIYHNISIDILSYLLSQKLKMTPELGWYISTDTDIISSIKNSRNKKDLIKMKNNTEFLCGPTEEIEDYYNFYHILSKNLQEKYNTLPTHTLEEFIRISNILKGKHLLYLVKKDNIIYGGVYVIKVTKKCWYTFYISRNSDINSPAIIYLMYKIANDGKKDGVRYIDYGISTENGGKTLNMGLSSFKELSLCGFPHNRYLFIN